MTVVHWLNRDRKEEMFCKSPSEHSRIVALGNELQRCVLFFSWSEKFIELQHCFLLSWTFLVFKTFISMSKPWKPTLNCTFNNKFMAECLVDVPYSFGSFSSKFEVVEENHTCLCEATGGLFVSAIPTYMLTTTTKMATEKTFYRVDLNFIFRRKHKIH
ncbi:uncharacterized protein LOC143225469 isoform X2 [Tachypleus tridentatus]|uniref:uncharacterized protein LOC143225469 isoform X2 n=1 Tax=Tachypleus tridentatus TaxID=6853 RepID=UPI003FD2F059